MAAITHLKFDNGVEITVDVIRVEEVPTTQHAGHDYRVTGWISQEEQADFYVGGSAMQRQCDRLGVAPVDLAGYIVTFRKKAGKRSNGAATVFVDVEWALPNAALGVTTVGGPPATATARRPAATAAATAAPPATRTAGRKTPDPKQPHSFGPPLPNEVDGFEYGGPGLHPTPIPDEIPPEVQAELAAAPVKSADDVREQKLKAAMKSAFTIYDMAFAGAVAVAKKYEGQFGFDSDVLHSMAATIAIEAGKQLRGDRY